MSSLTEPGIPVHVVRIAYGNNEKSDLMMFHGVSRATPGLAALSAVGGGCASYVYYAKVKRGAPAPV